MITFYTDHLLIFTARVNELILDTTLDWFSWYHWELFPTFQLISSRFFQMGTDQVPFRCCWASLKNCFYYFYINIFIIIILLHFVHGGYVGNYLAGLRMDEQEDLLLYEGINLSFLLILKINSLCRSFNTTTIARSKDQWVSAESIFVDPLSDKLTSVLTGEEPDLYARWNAISLQMGLVLTLHRCWLKSVTFRKKAILCTAPKV